MCNNRVRGLDKLLPGQSALIQSIDITGSLRRRLQDLGFIEGTEIRMLRKSPFGDPIAYAVRGATYAIRSSVAKRIKVRRLSLDAPRIPYRGSRGQPEHR